jgi:hypothetical protein
VWFICFAGPEGKDPEVAHRGRRRAGELDGRPDAAPIAREVLQALLPSEANS